MRFYISFSKAKFYYAISMIYFFYTAFTSFGKVIAQTVEQHSDWASTTGELRIFVDSLPILPLTIDNIKRNCLNTTHRVFVEDLFSKCKGVFTDVSVYTGFLDGSDRSPQSVYKTITVKYVQDLENFFSTLNNRPRETIPPHEPFIIGINGVIAPWGHIYNAKGKYDIGGCIEHKFIWLQQQNFHLDDKLIYIRFEDPIIYISRPFSVYAHDLLEVLPQFYMMRDLINMFPLTPIVIPGGLDHKGLRMLLRKYLWHAETQQHLNIVQAEDNHVYISSFIIAVLNGKSPGNGADCMFISPASVRQIRSVIRGSSELKPMSNAILVHDRRFDHTRKLEQGDHILSVLKKRYSTRLIERFDGNETFVDAVMKFKRTKVFISVHGSGMSNAIFMPDKSVVIEIRPFNWDIKCFEKVTNALGFYHFLFYSGYGGYGGNISVDLKLLEPIIFSIIDNYDKVSNRYY